MSKLVIVGCSVLFLYSLLLQRCDAMPFQILPMREGYVPVYIQMGDTPLSEINPDLALAFHEPGIANGRQLKSDDGYMIGSSAQSYPVVAAPAKTVPKQNTVEIAQPPQPVQHKL